MEHWQHGGEALFCRSLEFFIRSSFRRTQSMPALRYSKQIPNSNKIEPPVWSLLEHNMPNDQPNLFGMTECSASQSGFVAIVTIVVLAALTVLLGYSAGILGISEIQLGYTSQKGLEAFSAADGCMEEALERIRKNNAYGVGAGTQNYTLGNGSCTVDVTDLGGGQRQIVITGTSGFYNKKIQTTITITAGSITVNTWAELST